MPLEPDDRETNEKAFAEFSQEESDRQTKLFLTTGTYEQVWPFQLTDTLIVRVDIYRGMRGQGFVIVAREIREDGWWNRTIDAGKEQRTKGWNKKLMSNVSI